MVVLGRWLDEVILEVSSNLDALVILCFERTICQNAESLSSPVKDRDAFQCQRFLEMK